MTHPSDVSARWWPTSVPPVGHPRHLELLQKWCLDQAPSVLREYPVVHRHLAVLLLLTRNHLEGCLQSARLAYSQMRVQLAPLQAPETVAAALTATAAIGKDYAQSLAFVDAMWAAHIEPE